MKGNIQYPYCERILPVPDRPDAPLWSVIIPTYNCAHYLRATLTSVLAQDPGRDHMEIIVVDDASEKDDPEAVITEFERGRITFFRQPLNVGKSRNYATGLALSQGRYIHILHGDDTVNPGFYSEIESLFDQYPAASAAFCQCNYINKDHVVIGRTGALQNASGILENFIETIATWQLIQPPSVVFKRHVYESEGAYDNRLKYIEDWEFYVRVAVGYAYAYSPRLLANYRVFPESSSQQSIKGGQRIKTINQVIAIIDSYLPDYVKASIRNARKRAVALYLINFVPAIVKTRDFRALSVLTMALLKYNRSMRLWGRFLKFVLHFDGR